MDPNETLKNLKHDVMLLAHLDVEPGIDEDPADIHLRVYQSVTALDEWLSNGGFLPDAWASR